jgi:type IV pilus assembly protein PilQ
VNKLVQYSFLMWAVASTLIVYAENTPIVADKSAISLDFQDMDVRKALQLLSKFTQLNLIIEESVQGKISLHISKVTPQEALQAILQLQELVQQQVGNTLIIRSKKPQGKSTITKQNPLLDTKQIIVKHRSAKEVGALFLGTQAHKTRGSELSVDARSNSLWIRDTPNRIQELEKLVSAFDRAMYQVRIEARIVSVNRNFDRALGIRLGLNKPSPAQPGITEINDNTGNNNASEPSSFFPLNLDLPSLHNALNTAAPLIWKGFTRLLDLELAAMENEGQVRIISSPHLMTTDRAPALIEAGSEIPYQEKSRYGTNIAFKKAVLSLQVTPEVTPAGKILLKLEVHHDKPGTPGIERTPSIDTQKLKTQVLLESGETVVLGGIYETVRQQSTYRVPVLGKMPILGRLFSQKGKMDTTRELLVFVTPHRL